MMDGKYSTNLGALLPVALFGCPSLTSFAYFHVPWSYKSFSLTRLVCCADAMTMGLCIALKLTDVNYRLTSVVAQCCEPCYRGSLAGLPGSFASVFPGSLTTALAGSVGHYCSNKEVSLAIASDMPDLSRSAQFSTVMASLVGKLDGALRMSVLLFQHILILLDATKRPVLLDLANPNGPPCCLSSRKVIFKL